MLKALLARAREARAAELEGETGFEGGFTLIELMVVLLIIAILLAIAIPTFLGVTGSAKDRAAQSTLTNVLTETVAQYQNTQAYPALSDGTNFCFGAAVANCYVAGGGAGAVITTPTNYSSSDPQFTWRNGYVATQNCTTSAAPKCVSVAPVDIASAADLQGVVMAVMSSTGVCWWVANLQTNPTLNAGNPVWLAAASDNTGFNSAVNNGGTAVASTPFQAASGITTAGTFYAQQSAANDTNGAHCYAGYAVAGSGLKWGSSYASAPNN